MQQIIDLTSENFASEVLNSDKPVFVDFWAPWCGPCKSLAPTIEKLAGAYSDFVKFAKVNTDDFEQLKEEYGVRGIPTVIVFDSGGIRHRHTGAQSYGHYKEVLDSMIGADVAPDVAAEAKTLSEFTALLMGNGNVKELQEFLDANPDLVNTPLEIQGSTVLPMRVLFFRRDMDRAEVLVQANAKLTHYEFAGLGKVADLKRAIAENAEIVDRADENGVTALAFAAICRQVETAKTLLAAGADPNHREVGEGQGSPVDAAIMGGGIDIINLLVENGGKIAAKNPNGMSTLHLAVVGGEIALVRCLIENGLDPSVTDHHDRSVAELARNMKHEEIAKYIENEIAKRG